jgi:hypothetical protein
MQKFWQKKLKLIYSKDVLDIVQFGSSVLEGSTPNDVDIAVFFNKIPLKEQLEEAQKIKKQLQSESELPIHISSFDFYSFFDKGNFAKEGILIYGKSLIYGKDFAESFGLVPRIVISYNLTKLDKKDKVKFNYLLSGKGKSYGLLREYGGKIIAPGLVEILPEYENIFFSAMKKIGDKMSVRRIFSF